MCYEGRVVSCGMWGTGFGIRGAGSGKAVCRLKQLIGRFYSIIENLVLWARILYFLW
jgi:hypothetical protein